MKPMRTLGTLAVTAAAAIGLATSANAVPTGDYIDFKHCPYTNTDITQCVYSVTSSGSIKLGNSDVPINKDIILQGGIRVQGSTSTWYDAVGADSLSKTALDVPGGLISTVSDNWFWGPLLDAFNWSIQWANGVTATAEQVGPIQFGLAGILTQQPGSVVIPVRVKLSNPFLGNSCYIGSSSNPVTFSLTTGTTTQAPVLTGSPGTLSTSAGFTIINVDGLSLVDSAFTAPAATNCGSTFLDRWLVTLAVNAKVGLPAAAGQNRAVMNGNSKLGVRTAVAASAQ